MICRSVINNNDIQIALALQQNAGDSRMDGLLHILDCNNDGYFRHNFILFPRLGWSFAGIIRKLAVKVMATCLELFRHKLKRVQVSVFELNDAPK